MTSGSRCDERASLNLHQLPTADEKNLHYLKDPRTVGFMVYSVLMMGDAAFISSTVIYMNMKPQEQLNHRGMGVGFLRV